MKSAAFLLYIRTNQIYCTVEFSKLTLMGEGRPCTKSYRQSLPVDFCADFAYSLLPLKSM